MSKADLSSKEWLGVYKSGDIVYFTKNTGISSSKDDWGTGYIISMIDVGTKATIVKVDTELICEGMYSIRICVNANGIIGWVHPWDLRK